MSIPCITSFDMNHQLLAWMTKKYGPVWKLNQCVGCTRQFFTRSRRPRGGAADLRAPVLHAHGPRRPPQGRTSARKTKKNSVPRRRGRRRGARPEVAGCKGRQGDREALQAERHALATRVAELERQLAAFQPAAQVTAPSSRAGSMDISPREGDSHTRILFAGIAPPRR